MKVLNGTLIGKYGRQNFNNFDQFFYLSFLQLFGWLLSMQLLCRNLNKAFDGFHQAQLILIWVLLMVVAGLPIAIGIAHRVVGFN